MKLLRTKSTRKIVFGVLFVAAGAAVAAGSFSMEAKAKHDVLLVPANVSALREQRTGISSPPASVHALGPHYDPAPGTVHRLGGGAVLAWPLNQTICWLAYGAGGCVGNIPHPIDWTIRDPDAPGSGEPTLVFGLAVDGTRSITVTLRNGRRVSASAVDNFYVIRLPNDALPWDVSQISAVLAEGSTFSRDISSPPPA
jgi:hypothetical protein